jgi:N-acetylmuramoyl-L-alanine amidase
MSVALAITIAGAFSTGGGGRAAPAAAQPRIVESPIPFGAKRKADMRSYARRHYGIDRFTLVDPKVIVQHYTANNSYSATYNTFAPNVPDPELHELPGVCAHYVIDRRGVIHQLVPLRIMCRHTVGLNWTAIGIEHVGTSDAAVMSNRRQLGASLRLTRWLQAQFGIATRNVIGHSESLRSPYHHERVRRLKRQTHSDFSHATMNRYRRRLGGNAATGSAVATARRHVLGRSVRGRRIEAVAHGNPSAARKVLVFGSIHGNEAAGIGITRRLRRVPAPQSAELWLVDELNPDGVANGTRQNARRVDLNRNFPRRWRPLGRRGDLTWSGPRPLSEPETRIARALVRRLRPQVTVWFHQPLGLVDRTGPDLSIRRRFARIARLPLRGIPPYPGTATRWQNHRFPGGAAFVVELPGGRLSRALRERCVKAVLALAQ